MARLRVIALTLGLAGCLAGLLAGCRRAAEAGTGSGVVPPAGWRPLPALAKAAGEAAKLDGIEVAGAEAWGEPARGCYAAWVDLRGGAAAPDALAQQILAGLHGDPALAGVQVTDIVEPAAGATDGTLRLSFAWASYHGRLAARLGGNGSIGALACFWNPREPVACEAACTHLLGGVK